VVQRVLATADALERDACARCPSCVVLATRAGEVALSGRDRVVLGRGAACDVVLREARVSRAHAALVRERGAWWVEDLGSRNGTWCDGERVSRRRLRDGDVIELGGEAVRCRLR
jgi:pSer/pThr/pTyr-binding forkhead associated (FHA) protein